MKAGVLIVILLAVMGGCKKAETNTIPLCVAQMIKNAGPNPNIDSVQKRLFQGKEVYYFINSQCCDMISVVHDSACNPICYVGGISNMPCRGENFDSASVYVSTVWRK